MRVFVGIPVQRQLETLALSITSSSAVKELIRPSPAEMHITLKAPQEIDDVSKWLNLVKSVCASARPTSVTLSTPTLINPVTLVVDVTREPLLEIHGALANALAPFNIGSVQLFEHELFRPHVTLGRSSRFLSDAQRRRLLEATTELLPDGLALDVDVIRCYQRVETGYVALVDIALAQ